MQPAELTAAALALPEPERRSLVGKLSVSLRKTDAGGRPRSDKPRCPCGANTLTRAETRAYDCCRAAAATDLRVARRLRRLKIIC